MTGLDPLLGVLSSSVEEPNGTTLFRGIENLAQILLRFTDVLTHHLVQINAIKTTPVRFYSRIYFKT